MKTKHKGADSCKATGYTRRHNWRFKGNTTLDETNGAGVVHKWKRGVYICKCGEKSYGEPH